MHRKLLLMSLLQLTIFVAAVAQETKRFKQINKAFLSPDSKVILITAHRGVHNDLPENSLPSFQKGIDLGIDVVEMDIRHTKDDSLVIMHDKTVDRTTNGKGLVADMTLAEIRKLRLTYKGNVTEEQVPTLYEALQLTKGKILVDLDIKTDRYPAIIEMVKRTKTESTVFFFMHRPVHVKMLKEQNPAYRSLIRTHRESQVDSVFLVTRSEAVHIDPSHYTVSVTHKIKTNGARVFINALGAVDRKASEGDVSVYGQLLEKGANIIQTDYPALLMQYLKSRQLYF